MAVIVFDPVAQRLLVRTISVYDGEEVKQFLL